MESTNRSADQISLISVVFLALKVCYRHLGYLIMLNLCFLLLSIPLLTHPGAKIALYRIAYGFLFDPFHKANNPLPDILKGLRISFSRALLVEVLKWLSFLVIVFSVVFWSSRSEPLQRFATIIAIYGLVLWYLTSAFIYPILAYKQNASITKSIRMASRLVLSKPFECLFYSVISFLLLLVGIILMGPILFVVPVLIAILVTLGYHQLIGSNFENVFVMAAKD